MAKGNCKFCEKAYDKRGLAGHESSCPQNPANMDTEKASDDLHTEDPDYANMSIEDLMDDITETQSELENLKKTLEQKLEKRGLRFARKEE